MLKSGLSIWCYTAPGQSYYPPNIADYSRFVESLKFTTLQPGGFGQLTCKINVANARIPRYELALFSHIVVVAPSGYQTSSNKPMAIWIGEMTQPELSGDERGDYINIQALGIGNCLRDDPRNVTYTAQTAAQIMNSEMTTNNRNLWMPISTDQFAIFPDNPATSLSPSYMGFSMEDIVNDVCLLSGDYAWGVWAHPSQVDSYGFPLGELQIHLRNSTTVNYQAYGATKDVYSYRITPSADRAYNAMTIYTTDPSNANNYNSSTTTDSRLASNRTQGLAPFRFRRYLQDYTGTTTVTASEASSIESTQLGIMKNPTNKIQMVLRQVRNAAGALIPLWAVQADNNINVPELAQRAQQLAKQPTAGVNLFYILSTEYAEDSSGAMALTLQCDNWYDYAQTRLARLELAAYRKAMAGTTTAQVQALGAPSTGNCGFQAYNASAGATFGQFVTYLVQLAATPTSITLSGGITTNAASIAASSVTNTGFFFSWTASASGNTEATRAYQTVGNCLLDVDLERGTFDHHCDGCNTNRQGIAIAAGLRIEFPHPEQKDDPDDYALCIDCPRCGLVECLNTALTAEDEVDRHEHSHAHRANQARLIRKLQTHEVVQNALMVKAGKQQ